MTIVVLGSINMDLVARVDQFPQPGETITGSGFNTAPGGKGANQAVACARLGTQTRMIGRVGTDYFGKVLKDHLSGEGVDVRDVAVDGSEHSGVAMILVNRLAENNIIIIPGANGSIGKEDMDRLESVLPQAGTLLLQLEVPLEVVVEAAKMAHARGVTVILDPAPARRLPSELYQSVDFLTPNLGEASILAGFPVQSELDVERASRVLLDMGAKWVLTKMGERGVLAAGSERFQPYPAIPVTAVDTVAAGDAFNGAFAAALDRGLPIEQAIHWGLAGGAWAVTRPGAQEAMPHLEDLQRLLSLQNH